MNLSQNLSHIRKARGLRQESLAQQLGVTPQAISKWETGAGQPEVSMLPKLADALGVSLDVLFGRVPFLDEDAFVEMGLPHPLEDEVEASPAEPGEVIESLAVAEEVVEAQEEEAPAERMDRAADDPTASEAGAVAASSHDNGGSEDDHDFKALPPPAAETAKPKGNPDVQAGHTPHATDPFFSGARQQAPDEEEEPLVEILRENGRILYANLKMKRHEAGVVEFEDGSIADLNRMFIVHRSQQGTIRIYTEATLPPHLRQTREYGQAPESEAIRIIELQCWGCSEIELIPSDLNEISWCYQGTQPLHESFLIEQRGDRLTLQTLVDRFDWKSLVSGNFRNQKSLKLYLPAHQSYDLIGQFSGAGKLKAKRAFDCVNLKVKGSGSIKLEQVQQLDLKSSGTTGLSVDQIMKSTALSVSGHLEAKFKQILGTLEVKSSGSASLTAKSGDVTHCQMSVSGHADIDLLKCPVATLDAQCSGVATLRFGQVDRVLRQSIGRMCRLEIRHKGL